MSPMYLITRLAMYSWCELHRSRCWRCMATSSSSTDPHSTRLPLLPHPGVEGKDGGRRWGEEGMGAEWREMFMSQKTGKGGEEGMGEEWREVFMSQETGKGGEEGMGAEWREAFKSQETGKGDLALDQSMNTLYTGNKVNLAYRITKYITMESHISTASTSWGSNIITRPH